MAVKAEQIEERIGEFSKKSRKSKTKVPKQIRTVSKELLLNLHQPIQKPCKDCRYLYFMLNYSLSWCIEKAERMGS